VLQDAIALHQQGRLAEAAALYAEILKQDPKQPGVLHLLGLIELQSGQAEKAAVLFDRAAALEPGNAEFHLCQGHARLELGRLEEALVSYGRAADLQPGRPDIAFNRGNAFQSLGRHAEALACYDGVLAAYPNDAGTLNNRGDALFGLGRYEDALASYERASAIQSDDPDILNNCGNALQALKRHEAALVCYRRALAVEPAHGEAQMNCGIALQALHRHAEALSCFDRALAVNPHYVSALVNRGVVLLELKRFDMAAASFDRALEIEPAHANALNNRGVALRHLGRIEDALDSFGRALVVKPDDPAILDNRADLLREMKRFDAAADDFGRILRIAPHHSYASGQRLHCRMHACDWNGFQTETDAVVRGVRAGERICMPFAFQTVSSSPEDLQACSRIFARDKYPQVETHLWSGERYSHGPIRLGYVSGEFRDHATSHLTAGLFEAHDKNRFKLYAFDNGHDDGSATRKRLTAAFDEFCDISQMPDLEAARLVRSREIDILINLNGYFGRERNGVFRLRPVPVHVNYLGFPATLGADFVDYIVADRIVIPEEERRWYDEKVVYLPDSYQPNDAKRGVTARIPSRVEAGLPVSGFVFCSFNVSYKFTPAMFDVWMRLLRTVEGSVLWLLETNDLVARNLRHEASARGVSPERLIFAPFAKPEDHLARLTCADLFLDSLPYNAHTTASDALWVGLPVVTCLGTAFPGRVAASLLSALGLTELIAWSWPDYEALALRLARDPSALAAIAAKLVDNRLCMPLFDTERYCRHLEAAFARMHERAQKGLGPEAFAVSGFSV
jgi:predicted O-linked N-acetylglucosamine transferase (SPINDLY family)